MSNITCVKEARAEIGGCSIPDEAFTYLCRFDSRRRPVSRFDARAGQNASRDARASIGSEGREHFAVDAGCNVRSRLSPEILRLHDFDAELRRRRHQPGPEASGHAARHGQMKDIAIIVAP